MMNIRAWGAYRGDGHRVAKAAIGVFPAPV
jgi:hypothetical protein